MDHPSINCASEKAAVIQEAKRGSSAKSMASAETIRIIDPGNYNTKDSAHHKIPNTRSVNVRQTLLLRCTLRQDPAYREEERARAYTSGHHHQKIAVLIKDE
ncbi:hypothetical protein MRX96_008584 [Rhipicephalus microplus]